MLLQPSVFYSVTNENRKRKKMKKFTFVFLLMCIVCLKITSAQSRYGARETPFQITLFPPIGTNGMNAGNSINKVSINILAGYAAGLNGVEFGNIVNVNRDFARGAQFSGFLNLTGGEMSGVQMAGFANINNGETEAAQFSGFINVNNSSTFGFQGAGFANFTRYYSSVVQAAGFGNFSHDVKGAQLAGFGNFSSGNTNGAQIAGFGNFSSDVEGAQISGFINVAGNVSGVQIGVLNYADTIQNGVPIGVLSIVRDGFREFEIGFSEGLNSYASFKIGVKEFYNIFSVGMQVLSDPFRWGFGYGIGTHLMYSEDFRINLEGISYQINEGRFWTQHYNGLQQLKLTFDTSVSKNFGIYAGPTFNLMVSDYKKLIDARDGSDFVPYHIGSWQTGNTNLKTWIGFTAGIRVR